MIIKQLIMTENSETSNDLFENKNLIYSRENSKGKTTYLRLLFYALGYQIPQMHNVNYDKISFKVILENNNNKYEIVRTKKLIEVNKASLSKQINGKEIKENVFFSLPDGHIGFLKYLFENENVRILNNLLGIIYIDQDNGWSSLNRGLVIGKIKFSIEELIAGLKDADCDKLIQEQKRLEAEISKYSAVLNIQKLKEEVYEENDEIMEEHPEKELLSNISLLDYKIKEKERKINEINHSIRQEKNFWEFLEKLHLVIKDGENRISVTKEKVLYNDLPISALQSRKEILASDLSSLKIKKSEYQLKLEKYYKNKNLFDNFNYSKQINKQFENFTINQQEIEAAKEEASKELRNVNKKLKNILKENNDYIDEIYTLVQDYATKLGIVDKIYQKKDFIFTRKREEYSGAILQKLVFAFKLAFLKVIEKKLNTKLMFVIDSPGNKEMDKKNMNLVMDLIDSELTEEQVLIASIYDQFKENKNVIEIKSKAIENRSKSKQKIIEFNQTSLDLFVDDN